MRGPSVKLVKCFASKFFKSTRLFSQQHKGQLGSQLVERQLGRQYGRQLLPSMGTYNQSTDNYRSVLVSQSAQTLPSPWSRFLRLQCSPLRILGRILSGPKRVVYQNDRLRQFVLRRFSLTLGCPDLQRSLPTYTMLSTIEENDNNDCRWLVRFFLKYLCDGCYLNPKNRCIPKLWLEHVTGRDSPQTTPSHNITSHE